MGDFKRTQQVASAAARKANLLGSRLQEGKAKEREGWAWDRLGDLDKSAAAFSESRDLAEAGAASSGNAGAAKRIVYVGTGGAVMARSFRHLCAALAELRRRHSPF